MIEKLEPYDKYKLTQSRWLKSVPIHWSVQSLRTLIKLRSEKNQPDLPLLSVAREKGVFVRSLTDLDENHNVIPEDLSNYKVAKKGNLVINKMKAWQGSMGIAPCDGIVSPAYFVFDLRIPNGLFAQAMFRSKPYIAHFGQASDGVRVGQWDLSISGMREIPVLLPPPDEQAAIVQFLEHANAKIERAIRAKRKLITLLNEQKQAIIHRAVTRGLDPNVKLKPSGIPWLGDVPEHWGIIRSKRLFAARKELAHPNDIQLSATQAYGVISQADFEKRVGKRVVKISMHLEKRKHVEKNDFVISMRSFQGGLERAWTSGAIRSSYVILKTPSSVDVGFFQYFFKSGVYIRALQRTADFIRDGQDLNYGNFSQVDLPVVPLDEQKKIASYIQNELVTTERVLKRTDREIELLREYRTTLTAEVVTGKLDVREAAKRLPVEATNTPKQDDVTEIDYSDETETDLDEELE